MLQLNLCVYDEKGLRIEALCQDNVAPQALNALLVFLRAGWSFTVTSVKVEMPKHN